MNRLRIIAALSFLYPCAALAEAPAYLPAVVVTANRMAQGVDETMASVSVVQRSDIDALQARDVADVLRAQAGVTVTSNGSPGAQTSVFVRGAEADQVLVLVDGVRVSDVTTGGLDWSLLPVDQIQRIEIVRGSRTALYGSDAIGGIIQIFTRQEPHKSLSLGYGSDNTRKFAAAFSTAGETRLTMRVGAERAAGFSATNEKNTFNYDADDDGYDKTNLNASVQHQYGAANRLELGLLKSSNDADFDQGKSEADLQTVRGLWLHDWSESWRSQLRLSNTKNDSNSKLDFSHYRFNSERTELDWQHNLALPGAASLVLGVNYLEDKGRSADYDESINNKAFYANVSRQG